MYKFWSDLESSVLDDEIFEKVRIDVTFYIILVSMILVFAIDFCY